MFALDAVTLEAPLIPGKIMAVGKNYADHAAEGSGQAYTRVAGFIKVSSCVVPHGATIRKPAWTETFDYENELAIVIGRECSDVAPEAAYDCVFGYTIMNDLSCRDVQSGRAQGRQYLYRQEFPYCRAARAMDRHQGRDSRSAQLCASSRASTVKCARMAITANQIYRIPAQIAWYSHAGFEPGDLISSGTPAGTGMGYKGPGTWYLQHGDRVECEIEGIGMLANIVTTRKRRS